MEIIEKCNEALGAAITGKKSERDGKPQMKRRSYQPHEKKAQQNKKEQQ